MSEIRVRRRAVLSLLALAALAACGKKGPIKPPEGQAELYQRNVYPDPASVVPGGKAKVGPKPPSIDEDEFGRDDRSTTTVIQSQ